MIDAYVIKQLVKLYLALTLCYFTVILYFMSLYVNNSIKFILNKLNTFYLYLLYWYYNMFQLIVTGRGLQIT